jgi:hypothetical protein
VSDERAGVPVATEHHSAQLLESLHEEFRDVHPAATIDEITADSRARFESMAAVEQGARFRRSASLEIAHAHGERVGRPNNSRSRCLSPARGRPVG